MRKILIFILLSFSSVYAQEEINKYLENLDIGSYEEKIKACRFLGKEKKSLLAIDKLAGILFEETNSQKVILLIEAVTALGYIGSKKSIDILSKFIQTTQNKDLIYASLISLSNISLVNHSIDSKTKESFEFIENNVQDDVILLNLITNIKKKLKI